MMTHSMWSLSLSALVIAGCASPPADEPSSEVCELNPEMTLQPSRLASNGKSLNGQNLNGTNLNRIAVNGQNLNKIALNGVSLNGQNLNKIALNGQNLNKIALNGSNLNGSNLNGVQLNGAAFNELVATSADGRLIGGEALVGAKIGGVLSTGETVELAISSFERAADGSVAYYGITFEGQGVCADDEKGMFVPGVWDAQAAQHDKLTVGGTEISLTYSCRSGVIAKCVTWGYMPWKVGADLHQSCTRMTRADYCGTGVSYTKDDTLIDVFDTRGIQLPTVGDSSLVFEAGWGKDGAVCVGRTRYAATTTAGDAKMPSCWSTLPTCTSFEEAKVAGATIGNGSKVQSRVLCD